MTDNSDPLRQPFLDISNDDRGALVVLSSSLLIILATLVVAVTLISRFRALGSLTRGDCFLLAATVLIVVQCVCITLACKNGLGRHREALGERSFQLYGKLFYASQIFTILCLACSKASAILFIISIRPFKTVWLGCVAVLGVVGAWLVSGVVSLAVQCDIPQPWDFSNGRCLDQRALYIGLGVGHIVTDLAILYLSIALVLKIQFSTSRRVTIAGLFSVRIVVPIFTVVTLTKLEPFYHSADKPWEAVTPSIWFQLTLALSVMTTCIPCLKRVLGNLQTGMMAGAVSEFFEFSVSPTANTSATHSSESRTCVTPKFVKRLSMGAKRLSGNRNIQEALRPDYGVNNDHLYVSSIIAGNRAKEKDAKTRSNVVAERSDSVEHLTEDGITQTIGYEVKYDSISDMERGKGRRHEVALSNDCDVPVTK